MPNRPFVKEIINKKLITFQWVDIRLSVQNIENVVNVEKKYCWIDISCSLKYYIMYITYIYIT